MRKPKSFSVRVIWSDAPRRTTHHILGRRVTFIGRVAGDEVCRVERFPECGYVDWSVVIELGAPRVIDHRRTRRAAQKACERFLRNALATGSSSLSGVS